MKVEYVDHMGSDLSVCNAARVSFSKLADQYTPEQNAKLIRYLAKHNHWTPFGHCVASFRVKAPIFVARQLGKHQVGLVWNEVSRRYVDDPPEFYVPETWRKRAVNVKQGSNDEAYEGNMTMCHGHHASPGKIHGMATAYYNYVVNELGICPEQARMLLPQSMYTEWIWSGSLAAFARVCKLRLDPHTQYETRLVAMDIDQHMAKLFPVSWKALTNE